MATFITLVTLTEQGVKDIKNSPTRFEAFQSMAEALGVRVRSVFWTMGSYDLVVTVEGDEEAAAAALMKVSSLGNVRSQTLRAYAPDEMKQILAKMP